jgi:hypothetical protein
LGDTPWQRFSQDALSDDWHLPEEIVIFLPSHSEGRRIAQTSACANCLSSEAMRVPSVDNLIAISVVRRSRVISGSSMAVITLTHGIDFLCRPGQA